MATLNNDVLSLEELAFYLKVSKSTLYKLAQRGSLPGKKIGKQWRFRKDAVDAWLLNKGGRDPQGPQTTALGEI